MKTPAMKILKSALVTAIFLIATACHTARAIEPLFPEDDETDTDFSESVELPQDSIGRVTDLHGTQWTKGADGHYRSDDDDCLFSKPLNKFICEK